MDHQRPDPDHADSPSQGARIEDDFLRPVKPMKSASHRRLPAALPFALAGLLVVTSVAFGATVINTIVGSSQPNATPVVLDDDPEATDTPGAAAPVEETQAPVEPTTAPTDEPTKAPTDEPTAAPIPATMTLTAVLNGAKVKLTWSAFGGADFAYYKVVRSPDATVEWPLGGNDKLMAAISDVSKLTMTDSAPGGYTFSYRVFAVKSSEEGYSVLDSSAVATIRTPEPTPKPTNQPADNPADLGAITATKNAGGTYTLTWAAYDGSIDFNYYKLSGTTSVSGAFGYVEGTGYWAVIDPSAHSWTGKIEPGTWRIKVEAVYYTSEQAVVPNTGGGSVARKAAETHILTLTVSGTTPAPVASISLSATVQGDGSVKLVWGKYAGEHFEYYKVVRSETNGSPTYPENSGTSLISAISDVNVTSLTDGNVVAGHTYHYRVVVYTFSAFSGSSGVVLAISPVRTVTIPTPEPTAEPTPEPEPTAEPIPTEPPTE